MIISSDGYSIEHYRNRNQIVITMPMQTAETLTNTVSVAWNGKPDFTDGDLSILLDLTRYFCERG